MKTAKVTQATVFSIVIVALGCSAKEAEPQSALQSVTNTAKDDRIGDVVFVHGLDGDAKSTWFAADNPEAFWPHGLGRTFPRRRLVAKLSSKVQ
jgi:hypothetical protein